MPKTRLRASPLQVIAQEFVEISVQATPGTGHGPGNIEVERESAPSEDDPNVWAVHLTVEISGVEDEPLPPYTGRLVLRGMYQVHESFSDNPARLIRVTGASMLYGAARELFAQLTARGPNGLLTLPSVSFYETPPKKKAAKKKATRKSKPK